MKRLKLAVRGASGRMGTRVLALAAKDPRFVLAEEADVIVDFTAPEASVGFAAAAARARVPIVIGTTGFTPAQRAKILASSRKTPVFLSPNFSAGVTLMLHLARQAARALPDYGAGILEVHHTEKKDSPSGTALRLAEAVRQGRPGAVPIEARRQGKVVGEHALTFAGPDERLTLSHSALSRDVFARGSLDAAAWVAGKRPGLYDMLDLMGLKR